MPNFQGVWSLTEVYQAVGQNNWTNPPPATGFTIAAGRINKILIASEGNATDFGGTVSSSYNAGCSSSTRMLIGRSTITYVEFATGGAQSTFGVITPDFTQEIMGLSNQTRGLFAGGNRNFAQVNTIDFVTIATTGNASDFGDMTLVGRGGGGLASPTRGVMGALFSGGGVTNVINYVTIATTGNGTDFGDMTQARSYAGGCSNATRGLWGGGADAGSNSTARIDFVTIATTGNATTFGNLTQARREGPSALASSTRGVWSGGFTSTAVNTIDFVTIATTGNATDFGDLISSTSATTSASNAHGGLS
jgi:hypothetical protein